MSKEKGVTIQIASEVLRVSINTLRNWDKKGTLRARRGRNGYRYYHIRDLEAFKKNRKSL